MNISSNWTGMLSKYGIESVDKFAILKRKDEILRGEPLKIKNPVFKTKYTPKIELAQEAFIKKKEKLEKINELRNEKIQRIIKYGENFNYNPNYNGVWKKSVFDLKIEYDKTTKSVFELNEKNILKEIGRYNYKIVKRGKRNKKKTKRGGFTTVDDFNTSSTNNENSEGSERKSRKSEESSNYSYSNRYNKSSRKVTNQNKSNLLHINTNDRNNKIKKTKFKGVVTQIDKGKDNRNSKSINKRITRKDLDQYQKEREDFTKKIKGVIQLDKITSRVNNVNFNTSSTHFNNPNNITLSTKNSFFIRNDNHRNKRFSKMSKKEDLKSLSFSEVCDYSSENCLFTKNNEDNNNVIKLMDNNDKLNISNRNKISINYNSSNIGNTSDKLIFNININKNIKNNEISKLNLDKQRLISNNIKNNNNNNPGNKSNKTNKLKLLFKSLDVNKIKAIDYSKSIHKKKVIEKIEPIKNAYDPKYNAVLTEAHTKPVFYKSIGRDKNNFINETINLDTNNLFYSTEKAYKYLSKNKSVIDFSLASRGIDGSNSINNNSSAKKLLPNKSSYFNTINSNTDKNFNYFNNSKSQVSMLLENQSTLENNKSNEMKNNVLVGIKNKNDVLSGQYKYTFSNIYNIKKNNTNNTECNNVKNHEQNNNDYTISVSPFNTINVNSHSLFNKNSNRCIETSKMKENMAVNNKNNKNISNQSSLRTSIKLSVDYNENDSNNTKTYNNVDNNIISSTYNNYNDNSVFVSLKEYQHATKQKIGLTNAHNNNDSAYQRKRKYNNKVLYFNSNTYFDPINHSNTIHTRTITNSNYDLNIKPKYKIKLIHQLSQNNEFNKLSKHLDKMKNFYSHNLDSINKE